MRKRLAWTVAALAAATSTAAAQEDGDAKRGAELYRGCVACHSLEPGIHLSGPSLAGLWGAQAGSIDGFVRYSPGLKAAEFAWDEITLNPWLAAPQSMVPDTYMTFRGLTDDAARADLIAFLAIAMAPGGHEEVVERGLIPETFARGQRPDPLRDAPDHARVTAIRHCGDSYFVTTADGVETPYWEMNVRLKIDSRDTGPPPGAPVAIGAGMMGDRVSVVFSGIDELGEFLQEAC